jgi:NAD(P)-dependent dehydrogenase (short-subunit alcohol dehydrogenase family)
MSSTQQKRVILITGANRGIGFLVVKKLASESIPDNIILLGCRDLDRGQKALIQLGSPPNVHLLQLDISSRKSIVHAIEEIKQKYGNRLDVIINNAAILKLEITVDAARATFDTNYYGIKILNEHLLPLLQENSRVINVSSELGSNVLYEASKDIQEKYMSLTLTVEQLDLLVEDFISAIETNSLEKSGYDVKSLSLIYSVSKAAVNSLTRIQARQWSDSKKVLVLSVCPGFCATDMTRHALDARPAELGAESILYVVNIPQNQLENGQFYQDGKKISHIRKLPSKIEESTKHDEKKNGFT